MSIHNPYEKQIQSMMMQAEVAIDTDIQNAMLIGALADGLARTMAKVPPSAIRKLAIDLTITAIRKKVEKYDALYEAERQENAPFGEECNDPNCPVHGDNPLPEDVLALIGDIMDKMGARK